jgi:hypothetical protein
MTSKKCKAGSTGGTALKIGSRVRCTDDGVEGRITWANGISVKIQWDDGEYVTWRRDSLAGRPIEILDAAREEDQAAATPEAKKPRWERRSGPTKRQPRSWSRLRRSR